MIILPSDVLIKCLLPVDGEVTLVKRESKQYGFSVGMLLNDLLIMPHDHCLRDRTNKHYLYGYGHIHFAWDVGNQLEQSVWFWLNSREGQPALCWDIRTTHYDSQRGIIARNYTACLAGCTLAHVIEDGVLVLSANIEHGSGLDLFKVYFATR